MNETLTLEIPEDLAQRARALAAATNRRVEDAIVEWIDRAVNEPHVTSLPDEQVLALCDFTLDELQQQDLSRLLESQREGQLDSTERVRLDVLLDTYRRGMLLKAQAINEAVSRGLKPRLDEHAA